MKKVLADKKQEAEDKLSAAVKEGKQVDWDE